MTDRLRTFWPALLVFGLVFLFRGSARAQETPTTGPIGNVIDLVCVGDSITEGRMLPDYKNKSAPANCARELAKLLPGGATVFLSNTGVSGTTTKDYLPPSGLLTRGRYPVIPSAKKLLEAHPSGKLIFSIMLGTNDSANSGPHGSPVSADQFGANLKVITDTLVDQFPQSQIIIHHPIWYSANTHNSSDYEGDSAHDRLKSYFPVIDKLVEDDSKTPARHLYLGDTSAYDHFAQTWETELAPEKGKNGTFYLHPNLKGAETLGTFWATAIANHLK